MKSFSTLQCIGLLVSFGLASVLTACDRCENVDCAPCNPFIGDIALAFDRDSLQGGFRKAEINGGYAVRYTAPGFNMPIDTLRQSRNSVDFYRSGFSLGMLPWPRLLNTTPYNLNEHNYRFVLPAINRTYDISNVEIVTGPGNTKSCCSCGENVRRRFVLNGAAIVADGNKNNERVTWLGR
ncbi:hypothetical protein [Hymenobacter sp. B1770]|uniref:hypothetical protein n=1 Tax=Hymenobacter sp. B1770 TaxID=1718788 RepID=UPI003CE840F4